MRHLLAIDSGGSKCDVLLAREDGVVLRRGYCDFLDPASGRSPRGSGRAQETVVCAVSRALGNSTPERLHVVGGGRGILQGSLPGLTVEMWLPFVHEGNSALAAAGESSGVVVLAGTGAVVSAITRDKRKVILDGMGPIVGDEGGGYHIGQLTLRAAARAERHPRHATSLAAAVNDAIGSWRVRRPKRNSVYAVFYESFPDRAEVASLAKLADRHAEQGDPVAMAIMREAADAIAETLWDVIDLLGIASDSYPLVACGSVAVRSRIYWARVCARAAEFAPGLKPVVPDFPPVVGLLHAGMESLNGGTGKWCEILTRTAREMLAQAVVGSGPVSAVREGETV